MSTDEPTREEIEAAARAIIGNLDVLEFEDAQPEELSDVARAALIAAREVRSEAAIKAEALREAAAELPHVTEGVNRVGTSKWPQGDRDTYSLAIEEAQAALRARADKLERDADD